MSKQEPRATFHGSFSTRVAALRKAQPLGRGAFIRSVKLRSGARRFLVLTKRKS